MCWWQIYWSRLKVPQYCTNVPECLCQLVFVCLIWFLHPSQQFFRYVGTLVFLGWTMHAVLETSCSRTQCCDTGKARTCNPSVLSQALYLTDRATALPVMALALFVWSVVSSSSSHLRSAGVLLDCKCWPINWGMKQPSCFHVKNSKSIKRLCLSLKLCTGLWLIIVSWRLLLYGWLEQSWTLLDLWHQWRRLTFDSLGVLFVDKRNYLRRSMLRLIAAILTYP